MIDALEIGATLLAIATLEGVRRVPVGSFILRQTAGGPWTAMRATRRWSVTSWCIPIALPLVLQHDTSETALGVRRLGARFRSRAHRARVGLRVTRALGIATLLLLALGIPLGARFRGAVGLSVGIGFLVVVCVVQAVLAALVLRRCGLPLGRAMRTCLTLLNPFAAHRAPELIQAQVVAELPPILALCLLLGEDGLIRDLRSLVYDSFNAGAPTDDQALLITLIGRDRMRALLGTMNGAEEHSAFCPRCGATFAASTRACSDCPQVALIPRSAGA